MKESAKSKLQLDSLHERHPGLTVALSGTLFEAASVCLNRHHLSPVDVTVTCNDRSSEKSVEFETPDTRMLNAWANDIDTTEIGAYGVSLAAVEAEEQLVAVRRAETLTGADWYVAAIGTEAGDFEACIRLEVSGVDTGGSSTISARLQQKSQQARKGASNLPAIASVVGFKERVVKISQVREEQ
jgi:hypothetical protein